MTLGEIPVSGMLVHLRRGGVAGTEWKPRGRSFQTMFPYARRLPWSGGGGRGRFKSPNGFSVSARQETYCVVHGLLGSVSDDER